MAKLEYRPHLDGLRAIAVLSVVAFHAFPATVPNGFIGVDIFFVISGFLISTILVGDAADNSLPVKTMLAQFYQRRIRRIFPALILVLATCFALGYATLIPGDLKKLSLRIVASACFCLNLLLSRATGYFESEASSNPVLHLWSLGVEEQFYLAWPLVVVFAIRARVGYLRTAVFLGAASFFWNESRPMAEAGPSFFLPQTRLWELLIGAIAAAVYPALPWGRPGRRSVAGNGGGPAGGRPAEVIHRVLSSVLSLGGCALIAVGLVHPTNRLTVPNGFTLFPTLGAALVVCSDGRSWVDRILLSNPVFVWFGLISYPLYLWHWPLLVFAEGELSGSPGIVAKGAVTALAILLAWLTYRFVEDPVRRGAHGMVKTFALAGSMAALVALSLLSYQRQGFPARFPKIVEELADFNFDYGKYWREGTYFLDAGQDETTFRTNGLVVASAKPSLYLWGDSHAAALYPGMMACLGDRYTIVQRTGAAMPPLLDDDSRELRLYTRRINSFVLDAIGREHPACVVLAANWCACAWEKVEETISKLKAAEVGHIVLVGPEPQWNTSLPQQLTSYVRSHRREPVPRRLKTGFSNEPMRIDALMEALCRRDGVQYISPCRIFWSEEGFLVRTGDTADSLVAFDYGHLTAAGSVYLVSHFPPF
jgi:peptidoglycan/LPS O-acetylase OafA/YrhL